MRYKRQHPPKHATCYPGEMERISLEQQQQQNTSYSFIVTCFFFFINVNRPCDKLHHHQSNVQSICLYNYHPNFNYSWATVLNVNVNKMQ